MSKVGAVGGSSDANKVQMLQHQVQHLTAQVQVAQHSAAYGVSSSHAPSMKPSASRDHFERTPASSPPPSPTSVANVYAANRR